MKRHVIVAFFFVLISIIQPLSAFAITHPEREGLTIEIPTFTENYGLNEFYEQMKELNGGLFRRWSPENKACFFCMIPTLRQMEEQRVLSISEYYRPDLTVLASISARHYIYPDSSMIPQNTAIEYAKQWALENDYLSEGDINDCSLSVSCIQLTNDCEWSIGFWNRTVNIATVHVNAFTGEIPMIDELKAKGLIFRFSEEAGIPSAIMLSDLFYGAGFDYTSHQWIFVFVDSLDDAGIIYVLDEPTMRVIPGANG